MAASEDLNFEKAHELSETLNLLSKYQSKSEISSYNIDNLDVFAVMKHEENSYVNYLQIKNGSLLFSRTIEVKNKLDEEESIILAEAIYRLRKDINSETKDIIVNRSVELEFLDIKAILLFAGKFSLLIADASFLAS